MEPGARPFADMLGGDPEAQVWRALAELRCAPFMQPYLQARARRPGAASAGLSRRAAVGPFMRLWLRPRAGLVSKACACRQWSGSE